MCPAQRGASNAACERVCATGQPSAPRRVSRRDWSNAGAAARNRARNRVRFVSLRRPLSVRVDEHPRRKEVLSAWPVSPFADHDAIAQRTEQRVPECLLGNDAFAQQAQLAVPRRSHNERRVAEHLGQDQVVKRLGQLVDRSEHERDAGPRRCLEDLGELFGRRFARLRQGGERQTGRLRYKVQGEAEPVRRRRVVEREYRVSDRRLGRSR